MGHWSLLLSLSLSGVAGGHVTEGKLKLAGCLYGCNWWIFIVDVLSDWLFMVWHDRYLIASHTTDYRNPVLILNTIAVFWLVIAKFPNMHKVRIFGINSDYDTWDFTTSLVTLLPDAGVSLGICAFCLLCSLPIISSPAFHTNIPPEIFLIIRLLTILSVRNSIGQYLAFWLNSQA